MLKLRAVWISLATVMALALTACGGGPSATNEPVKTNARLVVGITSDPDTLMPWKVTQFNAINVLQNVYGTLTELDAELATVPGLAESWEVSTDQLKVTLNLRKGVKFSDGSDFDAADVKYSLDAIREEKTAAVGRSQLASIKQVTVTDPSTVTLELSRPDAALLAGLASTNLAILSSEADLAALETKPVGTGPFTFSVRTPNQSIILDPNNAYWGTKTQLTGVEFRVMPDENAIVTALQARNVNLAVINDPLVAQAAEGSGLTILKTPQLSYHALQLKASSPVLSDVNVRLAIQCAIDRQQVLDTAAFGEGEIVGPITAPQFKSDPAARPCPTRDLAKAKDYLSKAGKESLSIKTIVSQGEYATSVNEAQNLKAQLAEAGITLEVETLESGAFVDRWVAGDFEAAVALNGGRADADSMYSRYFTSTGNLNKVAGYSSPELDKLFLAGSSTTDVNARKQTYAEISRKLEDNAAWIWLFSGFTYTATSTGVSGFTPTSTGSLQGLRTTTLG